MGMHVHVAERTDHLADELGVLLQRPLADAFAEELVVVPAKGVERWLTQRLSHRLGRGERGGDGVCAGVRFVSPRSLVATLTGRDRDDPWDPDRLVWPLLEAIDESLGEAWCRTLAVHLGHGVPGEDGDLRRDRRYSVARRLAGLFASYAVQRPSLLAEWSAGLSYDGTGRALAADLTWQPELWRRLSSMVDSPPPQVRHQQTVDAIRAGAELALPDRLSLFGHTRLPVTEIELLRAVAEHRDVHLWLPQASPASWRALRGVVAEGPLRRQDDRSALSVDHPLLASLGRDSRELQRSLTALGDVELTSPVVQQLPSTLLGWLQADLRRDKEPAARTQARRVMAEGDRSVQVHACHGPARQVEVLREVLVGLLADDSSLEPRDVLVMCPDIDAYAPLFQAAFGLGASVEGGHPAHGLRVRLADRGSAATNPLLAVALQLLLVAGGRATATEILDLAAARPVRHRFDLTEDDLTRITSWVDQSGVRWGLSPALRAPYRLEKFDQNTWRAGLDRLLLGVAMAEEEDRTLGLTLPVDDVASASVDLAGRLAELVDRLESCVVALLASTTLSQWVASLETGVLSLCAVGPSDDWQLAQLQRELAGLVDAGQVGGRGDGPPLRLADVRAMLQLRTTGRPTRSNFRTGALTVCTMVPMRSVPHRVVCLIGLDDGVFPRTTAVDGDDALARDPLTGERDLRSEDRQLLLDAVLAATDTLVLCYTGANEHSGQPRPPAVPLGELLDALDVTTSAPVRERVVVHHPLQPFDVRNFTPGTLAGGAEPFSFDRAALAGARAAAAPRHDRSPFLPGPLPAREMQDIGLADLQAFFAHPVRAFLRQRLDVAVAEELQEVDDAIPVELDSLALWAIGDRVLRRVLDGAQADAVLYEELCRGDLPPGEIGRRLLGEIVQRVQALTSASAALVRAAPRTVDVTVHLGDGRRLTGAVKAVRGERLVRIHYSTLGARHRMASWLDLLSVAATHPQRPWEAHTIGWHRTRQPQESLLRPPEDPVAVLQELVGIFDRGLRAPVPMPPRTAYAWADALRARKDPSWAARGEWEGSGSPMPPENAEPFHVRVFGGSSKLDALQGVPHADERWNEQGTRLGQYAVQLWQPLFDHERVSAL